MNKPIDPKQLINLIEKGAQLAQERRDGELSEEQLADVSAGRAISDPKDPTKGGGTSGLIYREEELLPF